MNIATRNRSICECHQKSFNRESSEHPMVYSHHETIDLIAGCDNEYTYHTVVSDLSYLDEICSIIEMANLDPHFKV